MPLQFLANWQSPLAFISPVIVVRVRSRNIARVLSLKCTRLVLDDKSFSVHVNPHLVCQHYLPCTRDSRSRGSHGQKLQRLFVFEGHRLRVSQIEINYDLRFAACRDESCHRISPYNCSPLFSSCSFFSGDVYSWILRFFGMPARANFKGQYPRLVMELSRYQREIVLRGRALADSVPSLRASVVPFF